MVLKFINRLGRDRKGQGLVEYGILVAGVAIVGVLAVSVLGHKAGDIIATSAAILPGSNDLDNSPTTVGYLIETSQTAGAAASLDGANILANDNGAVDRLGQNVGFADTATDPSLVIVPTLDQ